MPRPTLKQMRYELDLPGRVKRFLRPYKEIAKMIENAAMAFDDSMESKNFALMTPDGKIHYTDFGGHDHLAEDLGYNSAYEAMRAGCIYLSEHWYDPDRELTQAQITALFDWSQEDKMNVLPHWYKTGGFHIAV